MGGYQLIMTYTFNKQYITEIISHTATYQIDVISLNLTEDIYTMETVTAFTAEDFAHLQENYELQEIV